MKNMLNWKSLVLTGLLSVGSTITLHATHLRAGEITATRVNCSSRTLEICLTIYVNTNPAETDVKFGGGILDFGDGTVFITPERASVKFGDDSDHIGVVVFCAPLHTYPSLGQFKITYVENNRNADIKNITSSVNVNFFLETIIEIDPFHGCDNSPRLLVPPIDKACSGVAWLHNPGAYDIDGDSLSYRLILPRHVEGDGSGPGVTVPGYTMPNVQAHYDGFNYNNAQEDGSGQPFISVDPVTGTITWDSPGEPGEYNIAFLVIEWRKINDTWLEIGSITRDMQIIVEDCPNDRPILEVPQDICVVAGEKISVDIFGTDPNKDRVKIEVFSQTLELAISPANYSPKGTIQTTSPTKAKITYTWQTNCAHIKQQPYQVVFKITDQPVKGVKLASFATWNITVVGPQPTWDPPASAPNRSVQLKWDTYLCAQGTGNVVKADSMQIWRRIDSTAYKLDTCLVGMPAGLGYTKIKTVRIGQTNYLDTNSGKGMPPGAVICYRLVATFPAPLGNTIGGTESLVSEEVCVGPIKVDAPVMTNVSVDTTNRTKGKISVRWTPPFQVDPVAFPPPYKYDIYRATGFVGNVALTKVNTVKQTDTVFIDKLINTLDNVYNYRVFSFDNTETLIDTSAIASSVRLQAKSLLKKIEITWTANVPWSLRSSINPWHIIYRGSENQKEGQFVKIDSVQSNEGILKYLDEGTFKNEPLKENQKYCYRVETRGGYGFDDTSRIPDPLINFSQIVCAQPSDANPPCQPELVLEVLDCEEYFNTFGCNYNDFSNVLRWNRPKDKGCLDDVSHYRIYYSTKASTDTLTDYQLLVDLEDRPLDTSYVDRDLPSFARCYRLVAVDRSGNLSAMSEEVCNDNCPNYQLPNVFTPGNDDSCNDFFSAYSDRNIINDILLCGNTAASDDLKSSIRSKCPRFVLKVDVVIVDRWGKQVFSYASGGENSIFIDWNGLDDNGKELSSGIYFYSAKVTFETLKPEDSEKIIRGWVNLVRGSER